MTMGKDELIAIAKGAGIAAAGALLAYLADVAIPAVQASGTGTALALAAIASVAINAVRKAWFAK
jgi:hypothetical protein